MNQVKLGIIGLGNMGSAHCNNILAGLTPELKLTAAADLRQSRRDWPKETLPDDVVLFENGDQLFVFFFNDTATTEIYPLSLHDALPI